MELENHTRFPAILFRSGIDEDRLAAAVVARITYDLLPTGELLPAAEQPWKVSAPPWDGPRGPMESDEVFYRGGVDLFVFGSARLPNGRPFEKAEVCVRVGESFDRRFAIFGNRIWEKRNGGLVPGRPAPVREVPLGPESAYGGKDEWDELPIPFPDNPDGIGYYLSEESAAGKPLPSLEDPAQLIANWDDHPEPVWLTTCPLSAGPRLRNGYDVDEATGEITKIHPTLFNAAHPRMIAPAVRPGDRVEVHGVSGRGTVWFTVPELPLVTRIGFDQEVFARSLAVDQVGIDSDEDRVFVTYRYPFRYPMHALQKRSCELILAGSAVGVRR
jgi:hypothetical protein